MPTDPEKKRMEFPIRGHDKCPHCGSEDRVCRTKIDELKEDGLLEEHMFPKGPVWLIPLIDQTKPIMLSPLSITKPKIPILQMFWDVCANPECVGIYVTAVEFIEQEVDIPKAPLGMPPRGKGRGFPFTGG